MIASNAPEGWITTRLGNVLEFKYGKSLPAKKRDGEGYAVYGSNGIVGAHSSALVPHGGIIVGRKGSFGEVHLSEGAFSPIDTTYYIDEFWSQPVKFWFYQLKNLPLTQHSRATAIPGLNRDDAYSLNVPVPPLAEQKQISVKLNDLLSQMDTLKTRLDAIPAILKRFRQSVLAAAVSGRLTEGWRAKNKVNSIANVAQRCFEERENLFSSKAKKPKALEDIPGLELPVKWGWVSIDEVCLKITDGTHHSPKSYPSGEYMYVTSKNVREGYLNLSDVSYVDKKTHSEIYSRCDVVKGDVLYVKDGANTGLACVNSILEEISLLSSVGVLRPSSEIMPKYFEHYLNSPIGRSLMLGMMGGTAIKRLTLTKLKNAPLSLPPTQEQKEIIAQVEQLFSFADNIEQRVKDAQSRVNSLTQSTLSKAFRGELTAEWREENPDLINGENSAEALLKRIQAEKEKLAKQKKLSRKHIKKKTGKVMSGKKIIPITEALSAVEKPLSAQELLVRAGYPSNASVDDLEQFFLELREQIKNDTVECKRIDDQDYLTLLK